MLKKIVAVILSGSVILQMVPCALAHEDFSFQSDSILSKITEEILEMRTENVKSFAMSDGQILKVKYPIPVHHKNSDDLWQDIYGVPSKSKIEFSEIANNGKTVTISNRNFSLAWSYDKCQKSAKEKYQIIFGIKKGTFEGMLKILEKAYKEMRKKGGRARKLSVLDMLVIVLSYYHDYRTMENLGFEYGVHKQRICEAINWAEQVLIKDGTFSLPSKRELIKDCNNIAIAIIDVTEQETERPKRNQKASYSGKKTTYYKESTNNKRRKRSNYLCLRRKRLSV